MFHMHKPHPSGSIQTDGTIGSRVVVCLVGACAPTMQGIVKCARRPNKPRDETQRAAFQARRERYAIHVMHRHHGGSRAFPDEPGKPSYGTICLN